jgi:hypothetical protein
MWTIPSAGAEDLDASDHAFVITAVITRRKGVTSI